MKLSRYTMSYKSDLLEGWLVFNSANGHVAFARTTQDPLMSKNLESAFNGALKEWGFLVDGDIDEIAVQQELFQAQAQDDSTLALTIVPTYACNCRCAYCYEQDKTAAKSLMGDKVKESLFRLVETKYQEMGFNALWVEWYGGDPQLCLDVVEEISHRLMTWCAEHEVQYDSMMLSNSTRIGQKEAQLLADCGVTQMLVTVDGLQDTHNYRRPAVGVDNAFGNVMDAIGYLTEAGIQVSAMMNTDKVNALEFSQLSALLNNTYGVELSMAKLNDYAHSYGCGAFKAPEFNLYTHEEFALDSFKLLKENGLHTKERIKSYLTPVPRFCWGQSYRYYVVDYCGDVYKCDGWVGDRSRAVGNIVDDGGISDCMSFNPFVHDRCRDCNILPLCMGNCSWEQELCDWPCHPLLKTMDLYLQEFAELSQLTDDEFQLLA